MDTINLSSENLKKFSKAINKRDEGIEGILYFYPDEKDRVIKVFKESSNKSLQNKLEKIKLLNELKPENITVPEKLVYVDGVFQGYSMKYYKKAKTFFDLSTTPLGRRKKIMLLKKTKQIIMSLHNQGINIIDFNPRNFMILENDVILCDSDNWKVQNFSSDIMDINTKFFIAHGINTSDKIDTYGFNLMTVSVLKNIIFPYVTFYIKGHRVFFNKKAEAIAQNLFYLNDTNNNEFIIDYLIKDEKKLIKL